MNQHWAEEPVEEQGGHHEPKQLGGGHHSEAGWLVSVSVIDDKLSHVIINKLVWSYVSRLRLNEDAGYPSWEGELGAEIQRLLLLSWFQT